MANEPVATGTTKGDTQHWLPPGQPAGEVCRTAAVPWDCLDE